MKPVSTFDNFPTFANAGSRNAPGDAKYALGFVPADTLPAEWINYFLHGSTKGITDLNSAVRSIWLELSAILEAYGITASAESTSQILSVLNKIYPQFATCDTAESTQNKSIAISRNVLKAGNLYVIDMVNANAYGDGTATYPTLSINSGTAYPICDASGNYAKAGSWSAGQTVKLLFTGSRYLMSAGITSTLSEGNQNAPTSESVARAIANVGTSIVGEIKIWPGSTLPSEQWAFCNGAELSRTEYATLFSILGVSWGIGDGVTTFNIPKLLSYKSSLPTVIEDLSDYISGGARWQLDYTAPCDGEIVFSSCSQRGAYGIYINGVEVVPNIPVGSGTDTGHTGTISVYAGDSIRIPSGVLYNLGACKFVHKPYFFNIIRTK